MIPLTEKNRLRAALAVTRNLHENTLKVENFATGTVFTPIGVENGYLLVAVTSPEGETADVLERVAWNV